MSQERDQRPLALADFIIPVVAVGFTIYYMISVTDGPWEAKFSAYFVGSALLGACALFLLIRVWRLTQGQPLRATLGDPTPMSVQVKRVVLLAMVLVYTLMVEGGAGFTISNFLFLTAGIVLLSNGRNVLRAASVAAVLALSGYLLFIVAFETRFPEGPFERAMHTLFN